MSPVAPLASTLSIVTETTDPVKDRTLSWPAIWRGAVTGLAITLPLAVSLAIIERVVDRSSTRTGIETVLVVVLFGAYFIAGVRAGMRASDAPFTNGILAALGVLIGTVPMIVLIRVARGASADVKVSTVFGQAVIATFLGMVGGWLGGRRAAARQSSDV